MRWNTGEEIFITNAEWRHNERGDRIMRVGGRWWYYKKKRMKKMKVKEEANNALYKMKGGNCYDLDVRCDLDMR